MNDESQKQYWLSERHLEYHRRQFAEPYRSTVHLGQLVRGTLGSCSLDYEALDVGCGAGANIHHLARVLPNTSWTGVDLNEDLFALGKIVAADTAPATPVRFITGDFNRLEAYLPVQSFDLVFSIQTLSWLPDYQTHLSQLLSMLKPGGTAFVTSLFTDFLVEAKIEITQYHPSLVEFEDGPAPYNIYCLERFRNRCFELGASGVEATDFEMDVDLPLSGRHMGTFTVPTTDGKRLQQSGPLLMPWKFVAIRMGG